MNKMEEIMNSGKLYDVRKITSPFFVIYVGSFVSFAILEIVE